jgi:NAD(P)-dependent dehydrogenase (short-subunit alcohol dehydrogenase family)
MNVRTVLISGGTRGIGRALAEALLARGATVIVTARDPSSADPPRRGGETASVARLDVTDPESVRALARAVELDPGRLDVLVNNAGVVGRYAIPAAEVDPADARRIFDTNFFGAWQLTRELLPLLRRGDHPRIVNVSSGMGQLAEMAGGAAAYRTSKAALNALTRVLATEERRHGVLVNSMCPGWVRTELGGERASRSPEQGADTALWLSELPDGGPTGGFFRDRERIPW